MKKMKSKIVCVCVFPQIEGMQSFTLLVPSVLSLACFSYCNLLSLESSKHSGNHAVLLLGTFDTRVVILSLEAISFKVQVLETCHFGVF